MKKFDNGNGAYADVLDVPVAQEDKMTLSGTMNKALLLTLIVVGVAFFSFGWFNGPIAWYGGMFGGMMLAIFISMKPKMAPVLAPIYAILEGLFLGAVSYAFTGFGLHEDMIFKAIGLTGMTLFAMLMIYRSGIIPVTKKFRTAIVAATMGIMLMYLVTFVLSFFFGFEASYLHQGGLWSYGLSAFILVIASLNLLLDFDMIERGVKGGSPKYMEWYGAFGLLTTLVWLYFEFLRLLYLLQGD